jgi:hypothetical protein
MNRNGAFRQLIALFITLFIMATAPANAQELLANRSFESPVVLSNGNNFYATIPSWTVTSVTPAQTLPFNIIKPWSGYGGNPTATPTGGGIQYFDVNSASGVLRQSVTVPAAGMLDYSGWFSVRDKQQALSGLTINIRNGTGTIVATRSSNFLDSEPIGLWKQVAGANIAVSAGTYTFEVILPDPANFDLASLVFKPAIAVSKTSVAYSDPNNNRTNPKMIPSGVVEYLISAATPNSYSVTSNSLVVTDPTPAGMTLVVADFGGAGSGPVSFSAGASGLTYSYASLASTSDNVDFSSNGGVSWTYTPVTGGDGTDPNVTNIRLRPQGTMAASSTFSFRFRYKIN